MVKANSEAIIIISLLPALLLDFGSLTLASNLTLGAVVLIIAVIWRIVNIPVSTYLQASAASGKTPTVAECCRRGLPFWLRVFAFEILFGIATVVGLILLIVPGLIILRRYYFTPLYIVSKNLSIGEAMKLSEQQTKPVSGYVWGVFGVMIAFVFLAAIVSSLRYIGPILAALISLIYFFGPPLRWHEISQPGGKSKAKHRRNS